MNTRARVLRRATVTGVERLSPQLLRITFATTSLAGCALPHTDHYVKFLFPPPGADYAWPFDPDRIRAARPPARWPVTRTYTIRSADLARGTMTVDFVLHGRDGLAGPWAAAARPGDEIGFYGPGGAWHPTAEFDHFVLAGDESAAPAICAALEALPAGVTASVFIEIADAEGVFPVPGGADVEWVARDGAPYGVRLAEAVRGAELPPGRIGWFVHGVAEAVRDLRRYLFVELGVDKADVSISGYWRAGMDEDAWQASKKDYLARLEAEEAAARASSGDD